MTELRSFIALTRDHAILGPEIERVFQPVSIKHLADDALFATLAQCPDSPLLSFARQVLPNPEELNAPSISTWAEQIRLKLQCESEEAITLHLLAAGGAKAGRLRLIEEALVEQLKKKARGVLRRLQFSSTVKTGTFVQVLLTENDRGFYSSCGESLRQRIPGLVSPFQDGRIEVPEDKFPPARAYKKVVEALLRGGESFSRDDLCVDLGASPGSWTAVALQAGAKVIAVDRAPLRDDLMRRCTFVQGDGFTYEPPIQNGQRSVDWLLCDIIAYPDRSIALLRDWLERRWCKKFCVTIKFRGREDYSQLEELKSILSQHCRSFFLKQLDSNKNEVTAFGVC